MDPQLKSTLLKVAFPVLGMAVVLVVTKFRRISWREDLRLVWPKPSVVLLWLAFWVGWIIAGEIAIGALGMEQATPWKDYPALILVLRIAAIGILGPASEEILLRGVVFFGLSRTRAGPVGAIMICALAWAGMHIQYEWATIVLIVLDGIVLGTARYRSRSTFVPIAMHMLGNLVSIYQSLHP